MKKIFLAIVCIFAILPATEVSAIWVERVENIRADFIMGADVGSVISIEESISNHAALNNRVELKEPV